MNFAQHVAHVTRRRGARLSPVGVEHQVDHFGPLPGQFQHALGRRRSGRQTNGHDLAGIPRLQRGLDRHHVRIVRHHHQRRLAATA